MIFFIFLLQSDSANKYNLYSLENLGQLIIAVIATIAAAWILSSFSFFKKQLFRIFSKRETKLKNLWKFEVKSSRLKSDKHFNISSFKEAFLERSSFQSAKHKFISEKKNLIITGRSGLGKTRSAFEILSKAKEKFTILIPFLTRQDDFDFNHSFKMRKKVILFIDDLHNYDILDINYYLENLIQNSDSVQLLCTCRAEYEQKIFSSFLLPDIERFSLNVWTKEEGEILAGLLNIPFNFKAFDYTAGSLLYKLDKLKEQYKQLTNRQKNILESIKFLKLTSLDCNSSSIREIIENVFEYKKDLVSDVWWKVEFNKLNKIGFFDTNSDGEVIINDIYLEELIDLDFSFIFNSYLQLAKQKKDSGALFYLGLYFERIRNLELSERCYSEAIAIYPNYGSAYYRLGSLYLAKADKERSQLFLKIALKSIDRAIKYLTKSVELKSLDYSYHITLGYAHSKAASVYDKMHDKVYEVRKLNDAIQSFSTAIELNEKNSSSYRMRGFCFYQLKKNEEAFKDYSTSLGIDPKSPHLYYLLGLLYSELGEENKALQNFRECVMIKNNFYQAYNNIGRILAKRIEDSNLSFKEISAIGTEAIKNYLYSIWYSKGSYPVAYSNLGKTYSGISKFEKAIKALSIAIKISPNYSEAFISRSYAYSRIREFILAEKDLLKAQELSPELNQKITFMLAFCYQQMAVKAIKTEGLAIAKQLFEKSIKLYEIIEASSDENLRISAKLGKAITLQKSGEQEKSFDILISLFTGNVDSVKIASSIFNYLRSTDNDEQILNFLKVTLDAVSQNKIKHISDQLLSECTFQIQRLSKIKLLSNDLQQLLDLLKETFPDNHFVFKTGGVFNLNKALVQSDLTKKMSLLAESENDFKRGKQLAPKNPVFQKYIGIVNAKKAIIMKGELVLSQQKDVSHKFTEQIEKTNEIFVSAEQEYPNYPELFVEHAVFLYAVGNLLLAEPVEDKARFLLANQVKNNQKSESQVIEELRELNEIKLKSKWP